MAGAGRGGRHLVTIAAPISAVDVNTSPTSVIASDRIVSDRRKDNVSEDASSVAWFWPLLDPTSSIGCVSESEKLKPAQTTLY